MEMPCTVRPQGPWSPLGYQVVEVEEKIPATEVDRQPDRPSPESETAEPPPLPWALPGYRVVEVAEEASPEPAPRPSRRADAARGSRLEKPRPLARWGPVAGGVFFLLAAVIGVVALRLPAATRDAGDETRPAENGLFGEVRCDAREGRGAARETFGTAVEFVRNPAEAARIADKEQKLTFLLHVSGSFDDEGLT